MIFQSIYSKQNGWNFFFQDDQITKHGNMEK